MLLMTLFSLDNVPGTPSRMAKSRVSPSLDGSVLKLEGNFKDGLVKEGRLLKIPFVVVRRAEVAVGPSLLNPVAEGRGQLEVFHVAVHGAVKVAHGEVNGADIAYLASLLFGKSRQVVITCVCRINKWKKIVDSFV